MIIAPLSTNNNINHKGFVKNYRALEINLKKASFRVAENQTLQNINKRANAIADFELLKKENPIRSTLIMVAKIIRKHLIDTYFSIKYKYNPNDAMLKYIKAYETDLIKRFNRIIFTYNNEKLSYTEIKDKYKNSYHCKKQVRLHYLTIHYF